MAGLRFDWTGALPDLRTYASELRAFGRDGSDNEAAAFGARAEQSGQTDTFSSTGPEATGLLSGLATLMQPVTDWLSSAFSPADTSPPAPRDTAADADADADADSQADQDDAPQPRLIEMAQAAAAAYGDRSDPFLEGTSADWQPVEARTLGLAEQSDPGADEDWVFEDGIFTAEAEVAGQDAGEVAVHIGEAVIDGETTLMVAFRGTDNTGNILADIADTRVPAIKAAYAEALRPATDAILDHVADDASGIDQVLVTGHSLGGILAQIFMEEADPDLGVFRAATFGSSGVNGAEVFEDDRILHVEIEEDPILQFIDGAEAFAADSPAAAAPFLYDDRVLSGETLTIPLEGAEDTDDPLFAHRMPAYAKSVEAAVEADPDAIPADFMFGDLTAEAPGAPEETAEEAPDEAAEAPQETAPAQLSVEDLGLTVDIGGQTVAAFKVGLASPSDGGGARIDYAISGTSEDGDWVYSGDSGTLDLASSVGEATLEVEIDGDLSPSQGEALILTLGTADEVVEHQFDLSAVLAGDADPDPSDETPDPDPDAAAEPDDAPEDKAPQWSLHKEMESWLDDARDTVAAIDPPAIESRQLDLGDGRMLKILDAAEDRVSDLDLDADDLADLL